MLERVTVNKDFKDLKQLRRLYRNSFPRNERIPFRFLFNSLSDTNIMNAYYDQDTFVGMSFIYIVDDIVYLSYITIENPLRNKGYGSEILHLLCESYYPFKVALDIEEVVPEAKDYSTRQKRKDFYLRNNFKETGVYYHIFNVDYEILSCNGIISIEDWQKVVQHVWPRFTDTVTYRQK